jgi:hypothetical protein
MRITLYMIQDIPQLKKIKKADPLGWIGWMLSLLKGRGMIPRKMDAMRGGVFAPEILHIFEYLTEKHSFSFGAFLLQSARYRVVFWDIGHLCGILVNGESLPPSRLFDLRFSSKLDNHE